MSRDAVNAAQRMAGGACAQSRTQSHRLQATGYSS